MDESSKINDSVGSISNHSSPNVSKNVAFRENSEPLLPRFSMDMAAADRGGSDLSHHNFV